MILSTDSVGVALEQFATLPGWLTAVSDPVAAKAALERHVPEFASGELELRSCEVKRVRLKPGSQTALYRLTCVGRETGENVVDVLGEIVSPAAVEPSPGARGEPFGTDGWRCYLPELRLDLAVQQPEEPLPALPALTDPEQAREFLEQAIRACSPAYEGLRISAAHPRVVRAKASRSTVLYDLESDGAPRAPSPVIAKTYRGDKGQNAYSGMQALWNSKLGTSEAVSVAEPLAFVPRLNVLVQGPVRGESTLKGLIRDAFAASTPASLAELSAHVEKTAAGLAELHTCGVAHGSAVSWSDRVADVEETVGRVTALASDLAGAATSLLTRIEEQAAALPQDPFVPTHGSFRPNQVLLNAGEIGFIDFDRFCQAEPGLDVGSFCAALKDAGRLDAGGDDARRARLAQLDELRERFLQHYEAIATISRERVVLWEALDLFNAVLDCWTKMEKGLEARLELLRHHLQTSGLAP